VGVPEQRQEKFSSDEKERCGMKLGRRNPGDLGGEKEKFRSQKGERKGNLGG
jgi:hypothetical protein